MAQERAIIHVFESMEVKQGGTKMSEEQVLRRRRLIEFGVEYAKAQHSVVFRKWKKSLDVATKARRETNSSVFALEHEAEELNKELKVLRKLFEDGEKWLREYDEEHQLNGFSFDDLAPAICEVLGYTFVGNKNDSFVVVRDHNDLEFTLSRSTVEKWIIDFRHKVNLKEPMRNEEA